MKETNLIPVRLLFDAMVSPAEQREDIAPFEFAYYVGTSNKNRCVVRSNTKALPVYFNFMVAAVGVMGEDNVSRFSVDDLLRSFGIEPDRFMRRDAAMVIDRCVEWLFDCKCTAKEFNRDHILTEYTFRIVNGKSNRKPGTYNYEIEWYPGFLKYIKDAPHKILVSSHFGCVGSLNPSYLGNSIAYHVECRSKMRGSSHNDVFRLETWLKKWGIREPSENPKNFSRDMKRINKEITDRYEDVKWFVGKKEVQINQVSAKNWKDASVKVSGRKWEIENGEED